MEITILKYRLLSKHVSKNAATWRWQKKPCTKKFVQKIMPPNYHMNLKTFIEGLPITYTLGKMFFTVVNFEGLRDSAFQTE